MLRLPLCAKTLAPDSLIPSTFADATFIYLEKADSCAGAGALCALGTWALAENTNVLSGDKCCN